VSTQKGTILKAIVVGFLNLLNRKSYRQSIFFMSELVPNKDTNISIAELSKN